MATILENYNLYIVAIRVTIIYMTTFEYIGTMPFNPNKTNIYRKYIMIEAEMKKIKDWEWSVRIRKDKILTYFVVKVSKRRHKKYDVYLKEKEKDKYLFSFGDNRYEQYRDKFGYYSAIDHFDLIRRNAYYKRHKRTDDIFSAKYWSNYFLW